MRIDARRSEITEALKKLREVFCSCRGDDTSIEVLTRDNKDAQQVRAFAAMSGFTTAVYPEDGYFRVHITGSSCACFR